MLLLLPPSEGKTAPDAGPPVDLDALAHPALRPVREARLNALRALSTGDEATALKELKLGPRSAAELTLNRDLLAAPTASAWRVYTGVLFERLGFGTLSAAARRRAHDRVLVVSALWGVVRPGDRLPAYRCPAGARLPGVPTAKAHWRPALDAALPTDGLVVDLRSGAYRDLWAGPADGTTVAVDVVREQDGARTVVSHDAKATRGAVARALLEDGGASRVRRADGLAERVARAGWDVELEPAKGCGDAHRLVVVERA